MNSPNDEPSKKTTPRPVSGSRGSILSRGLWFKLAALALTLVSALAGLGLARLLRQPTLVEDKKSDSAMKIPARFFQNWGKPDLVLVLTAQQHGYMLPCGCSYPQVGGLERRYNFIHLLKERGWPVVAIDLGDVPQKRGPANLPNVQGLIKYRYSLMALKEMGYLAVGIGEYEAALSLSQVEGEWAASFPQPAVLVGNLEKPENFPFLKALEIQTVPGANLRVGVTNAIGPTTAEHIKDPAAKFKNTAAAVGAELAKMQAQKVDLPILLYHGLATPPREEARKCAEAFPQIPVILALSEEDEPPAEPIRVVDNKTGTTNYVFQLGHKGKNVGVLGVYRTGKANPAFSFKYQLVEMGVEYVTPKEQEAGHPIMKMMEDYTRELKSQNYLGKYGQSTHILQAMDRVEGLRNPENGVPTYIGTEKCKKCHEHAYDVWKKSPHSHAYKTLVDAKYPSLRQDDGECIVCHTVGFGYRTGFTDANKTPHLENVGCESCHGPGSLHAKNPQDPEWQKRMNQSWVGAKGKGEKAKNLAIDKFCQSCHDIDNDVTWIHGAFEKKWKKIIHTTTP